MNDLIKEHILDSRTFAEATHHRRTQMKRSWKLGVDDMQTGRGLHVPELDRRHDGGLTWGDIGRMIGYILGPDLNGVDQNEIFKRAKEWGAEHDAWLLTRRHRGLRE